MFSRPFAVGALAIACVSAAGAGAYVAVRQNHQEAPPAIAVGAQSADAAKPVTPAVQDTEAVVAPPAPVTEPLEQPQSAAAELADAPAPPTRMSRTRNAAGSGANARRAEKPSSSRPATSVTQPPRPSVAPVTEAPAAAPAETGPAAAPAAYEPPRAEPAPAPPALATEELVVPSSSVMGLQIQTMVSTERARVEDRVDARVTRDLMVDGRTAVPAGTRVVGSVTLVERGGKVKERARLGVRFHTLVLADGTELPIRTEAIVREGDSPTGESSRKIGGAAAGGAILGAIIGGKKGAIIGGATGAAGGTAAVMAGDRNAATLPVGAVVTVRLSAPLTVSVEKN